VKSRLKGLTFAETPLSAISRFTWSSGASDASSPFKASREDGSSFRADLEESTPNERLFMKFVSLRTQRTHRRGKLHKPSRVAHESLEKPMTVAHQIHTYTQLRQQIHDDLRVQHPEWVQPDGKSPMCDSYEARLVKLLDNLTRRESTQSIVDPHRLLEQGAN
jgi:hypothetical protein